MGPTSGLNGGVLDPDIRDVNTGSPNEDFARAISAAKKSMEVCFSMMEQMLRVNGAGTNKTSSISTVPATSKLPQVTQTPQSLLDLRGGIEYPSYNSALPIVSFVSRKSSVGMFHCISTEAQRAAAEEQEERKRLRQNSTHARWAREQTLFNKAHELHMLSKSEVYLVVTRRDERESQIYNTQPDKVLPVFEEMVRASSLSLTADIPC
ncbi:hypothetical protein SLS64_002114 [Diaporthe eres]|uniref:Uncharacterized protein n=1 Tax=Diaporthe eres TaxID=83184 RepID=A0ABR1PN59_DIAER